MHLVAFDIDGTLVDSAEYESELYAAAIADILGVPIARDWSRYRNVTDGGILDQLIDENNLAPDREEIHARAKALFLSNTKRHFANQPNSIKEIPGAKALIDQLKAKPSFTVAIATGGWEETARLKLKGIGVELDGMALASGSDAISRTGILEIAEARALGDTVASKRTYFGDGIWDKRASEALGFDFIAIGNAVSHAATFSDLTAHEAIFRHLGL